MQSRLKTIMLSVVLLATVTACATSGHVKNNFCLLASPIYLESATIDVMTDREVDAVLEHNDLGATLCGW